MIVRCKNCNSAFAVDDDKVSGKKFAFSCLKCGTENIIDNRISQKTEVSELISPPDMTPDFADNIDSHSIPDAKPIQTSDDTDLFTDDEILSFQDENEIEIQTGDEIDESEIFFEDIEENNFQEKGKDEPKLNRQEDIDQLFAVIPDSEKESIADENEPLDLDSIDLEFEDIASDDADELIIPENDFTTEDEIDIDLSDLDLDMEESENITDDLDSANGIALDFDEDDLTLDIDNLDIDLAEDDLIEDDIKDLSDSSSDSDEELTLNLDELDIDLVDADLQEAEAPLSIVETDDENEDLTLNLDELDIDLDDMHYADDKSEIISKPLSDPDDEDLTLNLNELDIELEDDAIKASLEEINSEIQDDLDIDEDESITIDLDTLDIDVEEYAVSGDFSDLEIEEKLTIDDAGITFDELIKDDIKPFLDEVDPDSGLQRIIDNSIEEEMPVIDTLDELPEIDLDEYDDYLTMNSTPEHVRTPLADDNEINFDDIEIIPIDDDFDIYAPDDDFSDASIPARGTTALTIDFSLKYSRLEAFLRLTGLYLISLIPHFIVLLLYMAVSAVLGFVNQVVILFTGRCLEDFAQITENTLRYLISIKTNITGIVEDRPQFSGKENLNHQLQINITYPLKYSKNIAILRLSIVGILLFTLPHLAILAILTIAVPFAFIAGLIIVIATGRWPGILFNYLTKYFRYLTKLLAFTIGLNDEYPPFRLE